MKELFSEKFKSVREELLSLEKEGIYVFHGTSDKIEMLAPKQPFNFNKQTKNLEPHGEPAICASQYSDVAIFMALFDSKNFPDIHFSKSFGLDENNKLTFYVEKIALDQVSDKTGVVMVLDKGEFKEFDEMEYRATLEIKPKMVVSVSALDLPPNIGLIDKDFNKL